MRGRRLFIVALILAAVAPLVSGPPARATGGEFDLTFGNGGVALVDTARPIVDVAWAAVGDPLTEIVSVAGASGDRMAVARTHRSGTPASFGSDGLVTADFGVAAEAHGLAPRPSGFVAVGRAGGDLAAASFEPGGRPLASFGSSGRLVVPLDGESVAQAVSPDGLVVGSVVQGGDRDLVLAKMDDFGLVTGFNGTGTRVVDLAPGTDDEGLAVLSPSTSGFYVAGRVGGSAVVARFDTASGALDGTFGVNGLVVLDITPGADVARALASDGDGGVYIAGQAGNRAFAARLSSVGIPVVGFGGGVVQFDLGGTADVATGVVWRSAFGLIVGGTRTTAFGTDGAARRLTEAGAIDAAFGTAGVVVADFGSATDHAAAAVTLADGRFALAGGDGADMVVARFDIDGAVDSYLDPDGRAAIDGNSRDSGGVARLAPDGRIVVAGTSGGQVVVARRLTDGRADPTFGDGGLLVEEFGDGAPIDLAVQPDGRIIVLIRVPDQSYGTIGRLVRYLPDGRRDPSYGDGGLGGFVRHAGPRLVLMSDGRILVAGFAPHGGLGVARFLASGAPDASFGDGGYANVGIDDTRGVEVGGLGVQSDGSVLLALGVDSDRLLVARFTSSGVLVAQHGGYVGVGGPPVLAMMGDDRFYVTGTTHGYDWQGRPIEEHVTVARLEPDGSLDERFGTSGIVRFDLGDSETVTETVVDGPFLDMVVWTSSGLGVTSTVFRMTSTGRIDTRYGSSGGAVIPSPYLVSTVVRAPDGRLVLGGIRGGTSGDIAVIRILAGPTTEPPPPPPPPTPTTTTTTITAALGLATTPPTPPAPARRSGYWMLSRAGDVYAFGAAAWTGNAPTAGAVDLEPTPSGRGYWIVDTSGAVFAFGDARFAGSVNRAGLAAGEAVTSLSATPSGAGYWLFTNRGKVVPFGDAAFRGDMSAIRLNGPVLDSIATPTGAGYYLVASDGGIFAFGDARFQGSMGGRPLNAPVQSLVPDADGNGYWLVASDGGVFAFEAPFRGSMGGQRLNGAVTGMVRYGSGYLMVGEDGGVFNFSDEAFVGSLGANPPPSPIVAVATLDQP